MPDALQVRSFSYADFEAMGSKLSKDQEPDLGAPIHRLVEMSRDSLFRDSSIDSLDTWSLCEDFECELQRMPQFRETVVRFSDEKIAEVKTKWDFYLMICSECGFTAHE